MDRTSLSDAVFGSLPTELFQEIASYLTDPRDLAAFVNCCKTSLLALGKELIHIASAKEWAAAHAEKEALRLWDDSDYESSPPKATLVWASERCSDKDEFTWILNLYKKHYPKCLEYKGFRLDELEEPTYAFHYKNLPLEMAILHRNTTAVKVLLDQGVKIPKTARNWMLQAYPGETDFGSSWSFKDDYSPLGVAIQSHENLSMDIIRSLVDAGHYVTKMHIFQAVRMNNGDLYKLFLKQALESSKPEHRSSVLDVQYINEAIHYSRGGDCKMLDVLIQSGVSVVDEDHAARLMENPYTCTLTELAIRLAHPQQALFLIRHQLLRKQLVQVTIESGRRAASF
ncbi:hypothetical protein E8E14_011899 [Neopestalotiopsis sp. 37M]|nr:hypothetical protein E8E14_011899 [Neopestalotiopsis sp. 37M]